MFRKLTKSILVILVFAGGLMAQPFAPSSTTPPEPGGDPGKDTPIPLDGGILYLLAAGGAYGMKKIVDHKRKKKDE